jgi:UDP-GlcNAc3NAcA epimerase
MHNVLTVVGARPQFVKAAPLVAAFRKRFRHTLLHTGQHFDDAMSGSFFRELGIPKPQIHLGIAGGLHGAMTGGMLSAIEQELLRVRPAMVVVLGDTNSTLAGALAAAKLHVPVAHVEAGLRSFDMKMPEEINRRLTDHVSTLLFCPTSVSAGNLASEGIRKGVSVVGDVMVDVLSRMRGPAVAAVRSMDLPAEFYLATIHRQENTDDRERLVGIFEALGRLPHAVVFPMHPRTSARAKSFRLVIPSNVRVMTPVGYTQSLGLILGARAVLTDSGGLQKEAFLLSKPCITIRGSTEWTETLKGGGNRLVRARPDAILRAARHIEKKPPVVAPGKIYGDGRTAERIAAAIDRHLESRTRPKVTARADSNR